MHGITIKEQDAHVAQVQAKPKLKRPKLYQVVLLNDDFTPMDFVVDVLQRFFDLNFVKAQQTMFQVHTSGKAVAAIYPYDIAETKVALVTDYARQHEYPLLCDMEACPFEEE
jgi:ATP-dependent Clp protease adaptor protein ClpS